MDLKTALEKVKDKKNLTEEEAYQVFKKIAEGDFEEDLLAEFLIALREKGEHWQEIGGAVKAYREIMTPFPLQDISKNLVVDTCGTGGDKKNTFNFSTAVAIALSSEEDIYVVKHGNRAVSSKCGSADLLLSLGIPIELPPEASAAALKETRFAFLFAPIYHPAFKKVANVRKKIGRSIFNMLGPLLNPAKPNRQLLGVYDFLLTEKIAYVLDGIGVERAIVVFGEGGFDEITITGSTKISELREGRITTYYIDPEDFGFERCEEFKELSVSSPEESKEILEKILQNKLEGPIMDMFILNLAGALYICEKAIDFKKAVQKAKEIIESGKAWDHWQHIKNFYKNLKQ